MKTRQGFVSNSSSSSFIIGMKQPLSNENIIDCFENDNDVAMMFVRAWSVFIEKAAKRVTFPCVDGIMEASAWENWVLENFGKNPPCEVVALKEEFPYLYMLEVGSDAEDYGFEAVSQAMHQHPEEFVFSRPEMKTIFLGVC
jgi:hypothetical protein